MCSAIEIFEIERIMMNATPFKRLSTYTQQELSAVRKATVYSVLNKIFDLAPPALIGMAVELMVNPQSGLLFEFGLESFQLQLWALAGLTIIVWVFESLFEYLFKVEWRNLAQRVQHEMRLDVFRKVQRLESDWFKSQRSGRLMSILNDDINQLERFIDTGANDLLQVGITVLVVGGVFFGVNWEIALLAIVPIPIILWGSFFFQNRIAPRYATVREDASQLNAALSSCLQGIETVKSFTAESRSEGLIDQLSRKYQQSNAHAIRLSSAFSPLIRMAILVGFVGTLVYGGFLTRAGEMSVGIYSMLVFLTQRLLWPLTRLGATFDLYQRAMSSAERALDLLDLPLEEKQGLRVLDGLAKGRIEFTQVSFAYPERKPILNDFSLTIEAGTTLGIAGPTGSGKSTLTRLLLRFYSPQNGSIRLDDFDLESFDLSSLRQQFGLVSQSVFLFPGTVRENIEYGRPGASENEILRAAADAECIRFIEELPEGIDTPIGERGIRLSGGQAQRISIARCLLKDPPIMIFDEATSSVDNETERAIQSTFSRLSGDKTSIIIAHRLSTIRHAEKILFLEEGQCVERGNHRALMAMNGRYARLWNIQTGALKQGLLNSSG